MHTDYARRPVASPDAAARRRTRGGHRRRSERAGDGQARARGGLRRHGARGRRRPRRPVERGRGAQRHLARHAHEHEPRDDRVLGLPGAGLASAPSGGGADPRLRPRLRRAIRRDPADPVRRPRRARGAGRRRLGGRRGAVRRRGRRLRPLPPAVRRARVRALRRRAAARLRLPGRRGVPRPPRARLRQRDQRAGDRVRPRAGRRRPLCVPQAALRHPARWSTASPPTGSGTRRSGRSSAAACRAPSSAAGCAPACCASRAIRPRSGRSRRTPTSSWRACRSARTTSRRSPRGRSPAARRSPRSSATPCGSPTGPAIRSTSSSARPATRSTSRTSTRRCGTPRGRRSRSTGGRSIRTCPGSAWSGMFPAQGPFFPLLELQARWLVGLWAGDAAPPADAVLRQALATPAPPLEVHHVFAAALAGELGVAPDLLARPDAHRGAAVRSAAPAPLPVRRAGRDGRRGRAVRDAARGVAARAPSTPPTSRSCAASASPTRPIASARRFRRADRRARRAARP